jgi:putative ATP-binding cassette transporter
MKAFAQQPASSSGDSTIELSYQLFGLLRASRCRKQLIWFLAAIVLVIVLNAAAQVRLNVWQGAIYDAIGQHDLSVFYRELLVFAAITSVLLVLGVSQTWLYEMLKVKLREAVSVDVLDEWLRPKRAYLLPLASDIGSHPDQRIQDDAHRFTELTADLGVGLVQSSLLLLSFIGVLWVLSAQIVFVLHGQTFSIPGYLVWCALAYAAIGSFFVWLVGRPLIKANADLRGEEAEFRFLLVRVDQKAEAIAIHRGEADERYHLGKALDNVLAKMRRIASELANLTWVSASYGWIGLIAPLALASPGYFSGTLSLGGLTMVVGAFYQVQQALRWYVDRFPALAEWNAALLRVMSYRRALMHPETLAKAQDHRITYGERPDGKFALDHVCVMGPTGRITLPEPHVEIDPRERVLISGTAKSGKTTFFRALAGLWPWGSGTITSPSGKVVMFLPQQPYLPVGALREVLTYPSPPAQFTEQALHAVLQRVRLGRLIPSLDKTVRWEEELTLDEQQRLAIGRALLHKPDWIIHDEAVSELDDDSRALVTSLFRQELAGTTLISIGRNTENGGFYDRVLQLRFVANDGAAPSRNPVNLDQSIPASPR